MDNMKNLIAAVMNAAAARLAPNLAAQAPLLPLPQFAGQHTNPRRNERRRALRAVGRRQFKKRGMHRACPARPASES